MQEQEKDVKVKLKDGRIGYINGYTRAFIKIMIGTYPEEKIIVRLKKGGEEKVSLKEIILEDK